MNNNAKNPYSICCWKPLSECRECSLGGSLKCRFHAGDLMHFLGLFLLFALPAVIGIIRGGLGIYLWGWGALAVIFFGFWEIRILCSHCPFYAEKGLTLHCIANYGCPKFWKYHPEPISKSEKIQLVIGFVLSGGYPLILLIIGKQWIFLLLSIWGLIMFSWTLHKYVCRACVNFSCMFNSVPKEIIDGFLIRNPVMRKAWEEAGWKIDA